MLVAGVDVGNSTTEIAFARLDPGGEPEWLLVLRRPTTGAKGSIESGEGVADLVQRAERTLGQRPDVLLLAELHPVETCLLELGRLEEADLGRAAIARPASSTPSGSGVATGVLRRLGELGKRADDAQTIAVVLDEDFEEAAAQLRDARERGWTISGVIARADDGVLIGNRFDPALPIVDEVADADALPAGSHAVIEVAPPGGAVEQVSDPLRLGVLLGFGPEEARAARRAARAVTGFRAAIVLRTAAQSRPEQLGEAAPVTLVRGDGGEAPLDERAPVPPPGTIRAMRDAAGEHGHVLDVFWRPLPLPPEDSRFSLRLARRRAVALALLAEGDSSGLREVLGELAPGGSRIVATESSAAVRGASTTPGAGRAPFVLDLGGGTVDLHRVGKRGEQAITTAGAGELVTRVCAGLLACDGSTAERAKRDRSARVETPFVLHHEDGSRSFRTEPAPPGAVARLCLLDGRELRPLQAPLAPEVWRTLRRAAKREVIGSNVRRAVDAAGGAERGELVTLVGGSACDGEVVEAISAELADLDLTVARGDVLGRHGPRAAVAVGLVLAYAEDGAR